MPLLNKPESTRPSPTRPDSLGSSSTQPRLPSLITKTTELSTAVRTPSPSTVVNVTDPTAGASHPSVTPRLPLPPLPADPPSVSANPDLDSHFQQLPRSPSSATDSPVVQQTVESSSILSPGGESNLSGTVP